MKEIVPLLGGIMWAEPIALDPEREVMRIKKFVITSVFTWSCITHEQALLVPGDNNNVVCNAGQPDDAA